MVLVRPAEPPDIPAIAALLEAVERFYGTTDFEPIELRLTQISERLFAADPAAHVLLAYDGDEAVAIATYSFLWPAAGISSSLYVKELYVAGSHRGKGVGSLLMDHLRWVATSADCSRMEWTTDQENEGAQAFYKRLGFHVQASKVFYRLTIPADENQPDGD